MMFNYEKGTRIEDIDYDNCIDVIIRTLDTIREPYKSTIYLYYFHQMSGIEIAKRLGVVPANIYNNINKGLRMLRHESRIELLKELKL